MDGFITSIYDKFFQPVNFCVMLFLLFRIRKRSSFREIYSPVYILAYHMNKWFLNIPPANSFRMPSTLSTILVLSIIINTIDYHFFSIWILGYLIEVR